MQILPRPLVAAFSIGLLATAARAQDTNQATKPPSPLLTELKALPGVVNVRTTRSNERDFSEAYEITFRQPLDHEHPDIGQFEQHVYLGHADADKPMLLETEGYSARGFEGGEMQRILGGNQVVVEHRYFGKSAPSPLDWQYLTVKNAADDMHAIVTALKTIYHGKWISSGTSKGGQTSLFYKCYYPDDVDATVAYVAPVNVQQEDPRIYEFLKTVGDEETREKIKQYQIALFKREDEMLPLVQAQADKAHETFKMGLAAAYEYGILEYPYAFWQYGLQATNIPAPDAPAEKLADVYSRGRTLYYYSDQGKKQFEPFLYQAFTEIGYYNYDTTDFKAYMKTLKEPSNLAICPDGAKIVYNPATMAFVYHFLQYNANHVIYVYGDLDAWSATAMQLIGRTDAYKIVVKDSHHGARIGAFSPEQKDIFYTNMERWLGMKLNR